ncbi:hypothetical protein [Geomonas sp.]|uniref:hypothetical protein n=1 Tax=Geomonas sp. TaxID=2651584 RepID=UPI002B47F305|nr:hypothetical protein [Geomonas sp.]HJV34957.1 hypothetical protein [Geomonas sp.]
MLDIEKMHEAILKAHDGTLPISFVSDEEGNGSWVVEVEPNHKLVLGTLSRDAARAMEGMVFA